MQIYFTYIMPISKNQIERLQYIHELLQNGEEFSSTELLKKIEEKFSEAISRRTLISDMSYLRERGAPLVPRNRKYKYQGSYSFFEVLDSSDIVLYNELKAIIHKLSGFNKIDTILGQNLNLYLSDGKKKVLFDYAVENLENSQLLPTLLDHILNEDVISIKYVDFADEFFEDTFHPYLLKEYNGRWYLFGLSEKDYQSGIKRIFQYAIDRIRKFEKVVKPKLPYFKNDWWDVETHFANMVGVTRPEKPEIKRVLVRVFGNSVGYLETKRLHHTQRSINEEDDYTDFEFSLYDNYEFRSKILALGSNAEVLEPSDLRKSFAEITMKMGERYLE